MLTQLDCNWRVPAPPYPLHSCFPPGHRDERHQSPPRNRQWAGWVECLGVTGREGIQMAWQISFQGRAARGEPLPVR